MFWVYTIIILVLLYMLVAPIARNIFKPYTSAYKNRYEQLKQYEGRRGLNLDIIQRRMAKKLPLVTLFHTEDYLEELQKKIERLGYDIKAEDLIRIQFLYFVILFGLGLIFLLINKFLALCLIGLSVYAYKYPIIKIESEIEKRNKAVEIELPELYSVLYYAYKRNVNTNLTQKIQSYINNCSDLFYKEMQLFIDDARNGEFYALNQFKKRVPIGVVLRFCDIMETRLQGYDNLSVMYNFKTELDNKKAQREDKLLREIERKLNILNRLAVIVPLALLMLVYFGIQLKTTLTM